MQRKNMSWNDAQRAAERWIDSLQLGSVRGKYVDIHDRTEGLPTEVPNFRKMVIEAARRLLVKRGAISTYMPE